MAMDEIAQSHHHPGSPFLLGQLLIRLVLVDILLRSRRAPAELLGLGLANPASLGIDLVGDPADLAGGF